MTVLAILVVIFAPLSVIYTARQWSNAIDYLVGKIRHKNDKES